MKGLGFLKDAKLASNEVVKPAVVRSSTAKPRNPETADLRVFKDGSVFPSAALVNEYKLGYQKKDAAEKGFGFDVFLSKEYPNTQSWPKEQQIILIASIKKDAGKVDLFSSTVYDENGEPVSDVMTQGANTFGKNLLEWVKETYGEEPTEEKPYVDLVIARTNALVTDTGIYYVPKRVSRGEEKGKVTLVTRENLTLFPLVPASWTEETEEPAGPITEEAEAAEVAKDNGGQEAESDAIGRGSVVEDPAIKGKA
jgi:hypothetical protein